MRRLASACLFVVSVLILPAKAADPVRLVVPFAAGGPVDLIARIIAQGMLSRIGADMVVDNRGGAGGVLGTEAVARAAPDGKTLLLASLGSQVISATLRPQLPYDAVASFVPIVFVGSVPSLLVVPAALPVNNLKDLIALAKTGHTLSYGSAGPGTTMNIAGELLNAAAGIKVTHVPYRGAGPAINDLLGGHLDILIADSPVLLPQVNAKTVKPLAVLGAARSPLLPDVPTTAELGLPDVLMENWYGVLAPTGLPPELTAKFEAAILDILASPEVTQRLASSGLHGAQGSAGFKTKLAQDVAYWGPAVKRLGINAE